MSNTEFVMVPRVPTEEMIVAFAEAWYSKRQAIDDPDMLDAYTAMLSAAPADHSEQPLDMAPGRQGDPVAMPKRADHESEDRSNPAFYDDENFACGWNACLDEITKLGPLYNHADPSEVDRLRSELEEWKERCQRNNDDAMEWMAKHDTLRAQLAERDALLVDIRLSGLNDERSSRIDSILSSGAYADAINKHPSLRTCLDNAAIDATLSASAEPSAPVEIDERAKFEAWHADNITPNLGRYRCGRYSSNGTESRWAAWQARAALARKP